MSLRKVLDDLYGEPDAFLRRLRSELLLHHRTLYQLWRCTGMDQSHFYKYFRGVRRPSVRTCARLDEAMGRLLDDAVK